MSNHDLNNGCRGKKRVFILLGLFFALLLAAACKKEAQNTVTPRDFNELEKKISRYSFPTDSLLILLSQSEKNKDDKTLALACKAMGQRMRDRSNFSQAIIYHQNGLSAAIRSKDTIITTQLLNQLGTDFRRIDALPEASDYHFRALRLAEAYSLKGDSVIEKNKVMALNGIGNIYVSLKNMPEADKYFREALAQEKKMGSALGQAINYANIGNVFKLTEQYDSALVYYRHSMEQNTVARSKLGIGLCHIHFGEIYEKKKEYGKAETEFQQAYDIMERIYDKWHWLRACLALGRINLLQNNDEKAREYILLAKDKAEEVNTPEHLSEVYNLLYQLYERKGDYRNSLNMYKLSKAYQDSVQNVGKINQALDMRINYEREKSTLHIDRLNAMYEMQKREKKVITTAAVITVVLMVLFLAALAYAFINRNRSNKILKNVDKMRSDFFTNVTHEFRTPLTIILGFISHIRGQEKTVTPELAAYLSAMEKQGDNLLQLVNRILNMAKLEAGMETPEWKNGNIIAYLQMIVEAYRLFAEEKKISLNFYAEESSLEMDFVPHYIDEIARNLLSNAIKFTPAGGRITLSVFAVKNNEIVIKVKDNGRGIAKEDLKRIFEPFYQTSDIDVNTGSGIGLHYVKQLTEAMHGTISVESKTGEGSTFTVVLPLKQQGETVFPVLKIDEILKLLPFAKGKAEQREKGKEAAGECRQTDARDTETTILVVEDNKDIVFYIQSLLPAIYRVVHANNGQEGFDLAKELVPDLIVSDVMMPLKDGFSLCREVKSSELLNHIPVILLTAKNAVEDQLKGLECGADAYIRKPFHPNELLIRVEKLLENRRVLKEKYLLEIFRNDGKAPERAGKDVNMDFLQRVTDIVYSEMRNPAFTPSALADKLCLSLSQLNRKMTAVAGHNPSAYILKLRIDRAKKKLASENTSITDIADECGFYDLAYFSRTFKKQTGITPSQYRRRPN